MIFSAYTNCSILFKMRRRNSSAEVMDCLHGIRVISTFYVVFGHSYAMNTMAPMSNMYYLATVRKRF